MYSLFSDILKLAADTVAPPAARKDDFIFNWKLIYRFYVQLDIKSKKHVTDTNLPYYFQQMLQYLIDEQNSHSEEDRVAECLSYVIESEIFDTISLLFEADWPIGVRQTILQWINNFLTRIKYLVLEHPGIYIPIQKILSLCHGNKASPIEQDEINLLQKYCAQVHKYPNRLKPLFYNISTVENGSHNMSDIKNEENRPTFSIINILVNYLASTDVIVQIRTCEAILILATQADENFARILAEPIAQSVCGQLIAVQEKLPFGIAFEDVIKMSVKWGFDSYCKANNEDDGERRKVAMFLFWLDFIDVLTCESNNTICTEITKTFENTFFKQLENDLATKYVKTIKIISKLSEQIDSPILLNAFSEWFSTVLETILNMMCANEEYTIVTLKFFAVLFSHPKHCILQKLVFRHLNQRRYLDRSCIESWSDEEDERRKTDSVTASRTLAPSNIHKTMNTFLLMLPGPMLSHPEKSYKDYMEKMQAEFKDRLNKTKTCDWPREAVFASQETAETFDQGPLLRNVLVLAEKMHENSNAINVALVSLIVNMCLLPHPYLHEYLFSPLLPSSVKTLIGTLKVTAHQLTVKFSGALKSRTLDSLENLHQNVQTFEELCKMLAAIAFIKYNQYCKRNS